MIYYGRLANGRINSKNVLERLCLLSSEWREDSCWTYFGKDSGRGGHKRIRLDCKKRIQVHRLSWEAYNAEPVPPGLFVLHTCDNAECFNPQHLYVGTTKQNSQDRRERKGLDSFFRKIPHKEIPRVLVSTASAKELAARFGVTTARIHQLWRGQFVPPEK
jgi:hypothetical protein